MVPLDVDADPSNAQSNAVPALFSLHASVPDEPVTVNRATGPDVPTVRVAVLVSPKLPVIVTVVAVDTALVETVNVPVVEPALIDTLPGTDAVPGALLDSETTTPPVGAAPLRVAVP